MARKVAPESLTLDSAISLVARGRAASSLYSVGKICGQLFLVQIRLLFEASCGIICPWPVSRFFLIGLLDF